MQPSFERPVFRRARRHCLALPEVVETSSWNHPNFRAGRKTFCAFEMVHGRPSIAFRLSRGEVRRALQRKSFFATPYGRGVWVSLWVDTPVDWKTVDALVRRSYRTVAPKRLVGLLDAATHTPRRRRRRSI